MIIFLYGEDIFRSKLKLDEIIAGYQKANKSRLNLKFLDSEACSPEDLEREMSLNSLFAEKKLVILKNIMSLKKDSAPYLKAVKKAKDTDDILVVYEKGEIKKSNPFCKFLIINAKCQEFALLPDSRLKAWVSGQFDALNIRIDAQALMLLISYVGNDLWQMNNEINKLAAFKIKGVVTCQDVRLLVKSKIEKDIFKTIDAISSQNKKTALSLLQKHLESGESPLYLLSMINFQFRNLLVIKELWEKRQDYHSIVASTKLHPFVVKKSCSIVDRFSFAQLKKIYQRIFQIDLGIKTGKFSPESGLDLLIAEI